jgi:pilus assembly protein CpaF
VEILGKISWKDKRQDKNLSLKEGKYLIGNTEYCNVFLTDEENRPEITAILSVEKDRMVLKIVGEELTVRHDGNVLQANETLEIGLRAEVVVGKFRIKIQRDFDTSVEEVKEEEESNWTSGKPATLRLYVARKLLDGLKLEGINLDQLDSDKVKNQIRGKLKEVIASIKFDPEIERISKAELENDVFDDVIGLGPLEKLLVDKDITEIMINRYDKVYIEKGGNLTLSDVKFNSERALLFVIERIVSSVGRRVDNSSPIVDARLLDGSRVNAVIQPIALGGACLTIRRFSEVPISIEQLLKWKSMSPLIRDLLKLFVESRFNIVVSGGTGSGKTTLLNALSSFIGEEERIVTIEDAAELQIQQEHIISLETRPPNVEGKGEISIRDLVKNSLRMRPDRIVIGECRGSEALDMLQAMNTGHDGSLTTGHANNPDDMLRRLETMVLMAGVDFPLRAIREQISSAVQIVVQQNRLKSGRRLVTEIVWIKDLDKETISYITYPLIKFKRKEGTDQGDYEIFTENLIELAKFYEIQNGMEKAFKDSNYGF